MQDAYVKMQADLEGSGSALGRHKFFSELLNVIKK